MSVITCIVTAISDEEKLKYTLESIVSQSSEEFDVIITVPKGAQSLIRLAENYTGEYVGFTTVITEKAGIPYERNIGIKNAKTELVFFADEGDYVAPDYVEEMLKAYENDKPDILSPRLYISGEHEPYYLDWMDMLATVPHIEAFDRALLNTLDAPGRVYKKKFFDLYSITFPEQPILYNAAVLAKCVFGCAAGMAGVAGAIYDKKSGVYVDGFTSEDKPGAATIALAVSFFEGIKKDVREMIEEQTGSFDGDEYSYQEVIAVYFSYLTDRFYRYFWYLTNEEISLLREKFEALTDEMTKERKKKISEAFSDLRFPAMYMTREDAAQVPMVSLLAEFSGDESVRDFVTSLYYQRLPFFELFIKKSAESYIPDEWKNCENIHILPDEGFFANARRQARGVPINVKDSAPLDPRLLSELSLKKLPKSMYQYVFAGKRKQYSAKTFLKKKGMAIK